MKNKYEFKKDGFFDYIGERKAAKLHPWIVLGLAVLYIASFPVLKAPILITVPAVVAGWFYYRKGGFIAGMLAVLLNIYLLDSFDWNKLLDFENGILFGHFFVVLASVGVGYLRWVIERYHHTTKELHRRERHLILTNMATKDILVGDDLSTIYYSLLVHLTNLFVADCALLIRFDEASRKLAVVDTTRKLEQPLSDIQLDAEVTGVILSALDSGRVLIVDAPQRFSVFKQIHAAGRSAVLTPLTTQDYRFGVVALIFDTHQSFDGEELNYVEFTSRQITLALRSIHQERMINKQLMEARTLASIEHALSKVERTGVSAVLQLIVDAAKDMIPNAQRVVLHLLDDERKYLVPRAVTGDSAGLTTKLRMLYGEGIAGQVLVTGKVANVVDVRADRRFVGKDDVPSFRSLIVVPIQSNEQRIGTISVQSETVGAFGADETNLLGALGAQVAIAIENANLLETTQQNYKKINTLYHLTQNLAASLNIDQLMKDMVEFLQSVFGYYHIQIYIVDEEKGILVARYGAGIIGNRLAEQGFSMPISDGTIGHVAETGKPFFTNSVDNVVFFVRNPFLPDTHSEMVLPITINDKVWGVLNIQEVPSNPIYKKDMKLMEAVTQHLAIALQKATLYADLQNALKQEKTIRAQLIQSERLAVVGRLLASVSHELNNPLQAIQNALFLLKDEEKLSAQGYQDMEVILSETERMASMIGRLRDTYRTTQAGEFREVDVNPIVEDVTALISTYMRHRSIAFEFFPSPELESISGIPEQIRQVMLNLFMNAIEAMDSGGKIIVHTQNVEDGQILLSVTDTGTGISPDVFDTIFDPFVTSKKTGTGLGLTITRDIILHHQGEISAENNPGGGATFKIWLPMRKQEQYEHIRSHISH